jgi:thymidylate synthase
MDNATKNIRDADEAFRTTLNELLRAGEYVAAGESASLSSGKPFREILHYSVSVENPRERLPRSLKNFQLPGAVARFVWMMAANDRLKDIEFYWGERVARYTDDGMTVPGSDYGKRMLSPRPGLNQIQAAIDRLKQDASSRRAAIAIYAPEDAVRESHDIPCAFGLMFHVRDGKLRTAVFMRSNNAVTLMPYNLFEFSLLSEVVAASLAVPLGPMFYFSGSMHVFASDFERAAEIVRNDRPISQSCPIPLMPHTPAPSDQVNALVKIEAEARHAASGFTDATFNVWVERVQNELSEYWAQFAYLLLLEMARKRQLQPALDRLRALIISPWKEFIPEASFTSQAAPGRQGLFNVALPTEVRVDDGGNVALSRIASLDHLCEMKSRELRAANVGTISLVEYRALRNRLVGDIEAPTLLAARELPRKIAVDEFEREFSEIRSRAGASE